jgi:hypothetical protein
MQQNYALVKRPSQDEEREAATQVAHLLSLLEMFCQVVCEVIHAEHDVWD